MPKTEEMNYNPWKDMRSVFIPLVRGGQKTQEVGVNDKTYFIPRGQWVEVPMPVWEVVTEMLNRQKIAEEEAENDPLAITPDAKKSLGF